MLVKYAFKTQITDARKIGVLCLGDGKDTTRQYEMGGNKVWRAEGHYYLHEKNVGDVWVPGEGLRNTPEDFSHFREFSGEMTCTI